MRYRYSHEGLKYTLDEVRGRNDSCIGMIGGCFDLLHANHVQTIAIAKEKCDILVVAINSDLSVRNLKGQERPIIPEEQREFIISSLRDVDYTCVFEKATPCELILKLKPDYFFKGGEYSFKEILEREAVESYGGQVIILPYQNWESTTQIIERIRNG